MTYTSQQIGSTLHITMSGRLTFSDNASFQTITSMSQSGSVNRIDLHLEELEYIDSSGIGMLLVLKEKCDEIGASMALSRPQGQVAKILRVACIDRVIPVMS